MEMATSTNPPVSLIQSIIDTRLGQNVHGVYFSDASFDTMDVRSVAAADGIRIDDVISFRANDEQGDIYTNSGVQAAGFTTLVTINGITKPIIFVKASAIGDVRFDEFLRLGTIIHELGHAEDMNNGVNYRQDGSVDLAGAEAYAEVYCLRNLNQSKAPMCLFTKGLFAKRLLGFKEKSLLHSAIYERVISAISEKKLKLWSKVVPKGIVPS